jgi:hypothetical protein
MDITPKGTVQEPAEAIAKKMLEKDMTFDPSRMNNTFDYGQG